MPKHPLTLSLSKGPLSLSLPKGAALLAAAVVVATASTAAAQPAPAAPSASYDYTVRPPGYVPIDPARDAWVAQLTRVTTEGRALRTRSVQSTIDTPWNPEVITAARNDTPEWRKFMALLGYTRATPAPADTATLAAENAALKARIAAAERALRGQ